MAEFTTKVHPALASEASAVLLKQEPKLRDLFIHGAAFTGSELEHYTQAIFLMGCADGLRQADALFGDEPTPLFVAAQIVGGATE